MGLPGPHFSSGSTSEPMFTALKNPRYTISQLLKEYRFTVTSFLCDESKVTDRSLYEWLIELNWAGWVRLNYYCL